MSLPGDTDGPRADDDGKSGDRGIDRRTFLRFGAGGALVLGVGYAVLRHVEPLRRPSVKMPPLGVLSTGEAITLRAVAERILDMGDAGHTAGMPSVDDAGVVARVDEYLGHLPPAMVRDVRALLLLVEHAAPLALPSASPFSRLGAEAQDAILAAWESSRLAVRRLGCAALKRLVVVGYYGSPRVVAALRDSIGYAPIELPPTGTP